MIRRIIFSIVTLFAIFTFSVDAQAFAVFSPDPLFSETNILPGDDVFTGRSITISHDGDQAEEYFLWVDEVSNSDMATAVEMRVYDASTTLLSEATIEELSSNPVSLGVLNPGQTNTYPVEAEFLAFGNNSLQGQSLTFVVVIGNQDGEVIATSGGGGSGGGGLLPVSLQIYDTRVDSITSSVLSGYDVSIAWLTNLMAGSMVVFGPAESTYALDQSDVQFGYPSSISVPGERTAHGVTLPNLAPGTYRYRVVSYRNGVPSVSPEYQFEITQAGQLVPTVLGASTVSGPGEATTEGGVFQPLVQAVQGAFIRRAEADEEASVTSPEALFGQATSTTSSAKAVSPCRPVNHWLLVALALLFGLLAEQVVRWSQPRVGRRTRALIWLGFAVTTALAILWLGCTWWPVLISFLGILLLVWVFTPKNGAQLSSKA